MKTLEQQVADQLKQSLGDAISTCLSSYSSPLTKMVGQVVEEEKEQITSLIKTTLSGVIQNEEFQQQLVSEFHRKVAKSLVGQMEGQVASAVDRLKQDPTFKSRMILAVQALVESEK